MKNSFYLILMAILLCVGCNNNVGSKLENDVEDTQQSNNITKISVSKLKNSKYIQVETWIDDFRNFRMAIYNNDVPKLKTYFDFPFKDKGKTVFHLIDLTEADWIIRKKSVNNPDLFYEADLEKYHNNVFDLRFTNAILKIKSEQLFLNHSNDTKLFIADDLVYQLYAEYNEKDKSLSLNMAFGKNAKYEDGNYVSEGEHNIIYVFKIIDNKKMKLERIDIAG